MTNAWGWPLPATDSLFIDSPYEPLDNPGENIAERLVMIAHLSFNTDVWSNRIDRYWDGLVERIEGACNTNTVAEFWQRLTDEMALVPLHAGDLLHEKNLLCRPATLSTPVSDFAVLNPLRSYPRDIVDRTRMWNQYRKAAKATKLKAA